jgi:hypothetical protein
MLRRDDYEWRSSHRNLSIIEELDDFGPVKPAGCALWICGIAAKTASFDAAHIILGCGKPFATGSRLKH